MLLLYILFIVAVGAWLAKSRSTDWDKPLNVIVYSINGDGSEVSSNYIDELEEADFEAIETFFAAEASRYGLPLNKPVDIVLAGTLDARPPLPPRNGSTLSIMIWSLKLRYWAWQNDDYPYLQDVQIFVQYYDPKTSPTVAHSLGLQKGLLGVVNAFARDDMKQENNIVIAHELLHTLGAIDKYDPANNMPLYPIGYAEPDKEPLHPQGKAEIMAGRFIDENNKLKQPRNLEKVVVGRATALDINWLQDY
ncbi:MAG: hypothetical protein RLT87_01355 [Gammaproteobacteria bacterium]